MALWSKRGRDGILNWFIDYRDRSGQRYQEKIGPVRKGRAWEVQRRRSLDPDAGGGRDA